MEPTESTVNATDIFNFQNGTEPESPEASDSPSVEIGDDSSPEPTGPSFSDKAKDVLEKSKEGVTFVLEKARIVPIWAYLLVFSVPALIGIVWVICRIRRQWRRFRRSDEGRQQIQKLHEHETLGKYFEKLIAPIEPKEDVVELEEFIEPEEEVVEEPAGEDIGRVHYQIAYDFEAQALSVTVFECEGLPAKESTGSCDSYVMIFFMGDKKRKPFETKVHRHNLNPVFNETFVYKNMDFEEVMGQVLNFEIYDFVRFKTDEQIGEFRVKLCTIELMTPYDAWADWEAPEDDEEPPPGDICISLRYSPGSNKLTVAILECKNLKEMDFGGGADPFAKIKFYKDGKQLSKKKTDVKKGTLNPYFNASFIYEIKVEQLKKCHFVVIVYDYDLIGKSTPIGVIAIGPNQMGDARSHYLEMMDKHKIPIIKWHHLIEPEEFFGGNEKEEEK